MIRGLLKSSLAEKYQITLVSTHVDGSRAKKALYGIAGVLALIWKLAFGQVDLVHLHGSDMVSTPRKSIFLWLAKAFGKPCIYHFHGASFLEQYIRSPAILQGIARWVFSAADRVICLSESWAKSIKAIAPDAKTIVLPNAVSLPVDVSECRRGDSDGLRITFLGAIGERKGLFDLIDVVKKLCAGARNVTLRIGGNGDLKRLEQVVAKYGLEDSVKFLGWIGQNERDALFRETDVYVLPSYGEGMPMSILEAMSYGIPVVSTMVGGIPELVTEGECGFLIQPGDKKALYERLSKLCENPSLRWKLGKAAREKIRLEHHIAAQVERVERIYDELLTRGRSGSVSGSGAES